MENRLMISLSKSVNTKNRSNEMGRPKAKEKFHIFNWKASPYWYCWFISDKTGKKVHRSTGYPKSDYTKEQIQKIIDSEAGTKHTNKYSINWMEEYIVLGLEIDGISDNTIKLYKLSFKHLKSLYGGDYCIHNIDRSVIEEFKRYLKSKGTGNPGINTYLRTLRAAFEKLVIDSKIDINPFHRYKPLPVSKNKKKHMTLEEAKRFLDVVNNSTNEDAKHLTRILLHTGIRRSEVLLIKRDDVDMQEGYFKALNIKSRDRHLVIREIPEWTYGDFQYFLLKEPFAKLCVSP